METGTNIPPIRLQCADKLLKVSPTPILETFGNKLLLFLELPLSQGLSYIPLISDNIE